MTEKELPTLDFHEEPANPAHQLRGDAVRTETIDITSWLSSDVYSSGSFDLSSIGSTSFGRLLDAIPMPAVLVDQWYSVGFANSSCRKITPDYRKLQGMPFLDLVPRPADSERAKALAEKTELLLDQVFQTRKSRIAEAILEIRGSRVWAKLHLRAVRIGSARHVLVLIEDLTHEKKQMELSRRQEKEAARMHSDLERRLQAGSSELVTLNERLKREVADHLRTRKALRVERQKVKALWDRAPMAAAWVAPTGTLQEINPHFTKTFGYESGSLTNLREWIIGVWFDDDARRIGGPAWIDSLAREHNPLRLSPMAAVACRDGTTREVRLDVAELEDGHYIIICRLPQDGHGG
ncbi:MAG: hypothetical protein V2B18_10240 [Pseudomonadota bacterium]